MIRILGPCFRDQGQVINDDLIYIDDHHYNEQAGNYPIKNVLERSSVEFTVVFDHLGHDDELSSWPHVIFPVYLAAEIISMFSTPIQPQWCNKTHCFNFMINKPRPNREYLLKYIHQNKLDNYLHTLAWQHSPWPSIPVTDYKLPDEITLERGIRNGRYSNREIYKELLQSTVFEPTCVSLITEPCALEREIMITEKTIMAILGGTLPIWVGGWKLPDAMRNLGFDVFDDVIDHGYSTLTTPQERMQQALALNHRLLVDFDWANSIVKANHARLQHNLDLIKRNPFLDIVRQQIARDSRLQKIADLWLLRTALN